MSETKTELNPCPECGGKADVEQDKDSLGGIYLAVCENFSPDKEGGCCLIGAGWTEEECIKDWNSFEPDEPTEEGVSSNKLDDPFHSRYKAMD